MTAAAGAQYLVNRYIQCFGPVVAQVSMCRFAVYGPSTLCVFEMWGLFAVALARAAWRLALLQTLPGEPSAATVIDSDRAAVKCALAD
jgi:hypothetical protein